MSCCAEGPFIAYVVITDLHLPVPAHFGSNLSSVFVDLDLLDLLLELCLQESDSVHVHVLWWGYCSIALSENTQAAALHWEWEPSGQTWLFERLASLGSDCYCSFCVVDCCIDNMIIIMLSLMTEIPLLVTSLHPSAACKTLMKMAAIDLHCCVTAQPQSVYFE